MLIEVLLKGETEFQEVSGYVLGELLARGRVESFRRAEGWVVVGRDPIRRPGRYDYRGPERRRQRSLSCLSCPAFSGGNCTDFDCPSWNNQTKIFPFGM